MVERSVQRIQRLVLVLLAGVPWLACTYSPQYQDMPCSDLGECPAGYHCVKDDAGPGHCRSDGTPEDGANEPVGQDAGDGDEISDRGDSSDSNDAGDSPDAGDGSDLGPDQGCLQPDLDGDGHRAVACAGDDCDDGDPNIHPGAPETCDGLDNDCDGQTDQSDPDLVLADCEVQVGVCTGAMHLIGECLDGEWKACDAQAYLSHAPDTYQQDEDLCDGLDNDCDGQSDDLAAAPPCDRDLGVCAGAVKLCLGSLGWEQTCPENRYGIDFQLVEDRCDSLDNDCDGQVDDGCPCVSGEERPCPLQDGVCAGSREVCVNSQWPGCDYSTVPGFEQPPEFTCNGTDNDCDGVIDGMQRSCDYLQGKCALGTETCSNGGWLGCPTPDPVEVCNAIDDTCDGLTDAEDPALERTPCDLYLGVCAGAPAHDASKCNAGQWQPCDALEYGPNFGAESGDRCADGLDNDCDGQSDCAQPGCEGATRACQNQCLSGTETCQSGVWANCNAPDPQEERPSNGNCDDGIDNDCDQQTDSDDRPCCGMGAGRSALLALLVLPWLTRRRRRRS